MDVEILTAKVILSNFDQLNQEIGKISEYIKYLADRKVLHISEDVKPDILALRVAEYIQSNMKIEMVMD